jgi:2-oxoglutarate dehydrogenase E2 component (dihydrolipoamide succinyltransferase)
MTIQVTVPELGESVLEATIGEWHKKEGEAVAIGDLLVELETDKVNVDVGAETAGVLVDIRRQTGEDVQIGDVLAEIDPDGSETKEEQTSSVEEDEESVSDLEEQETVTAEPERPEAKDMPADEKVIATPVAQRVADESGIDLAQIKGSGSNGRITRQDVEDFLKEREAQSEPATPSGPAGQAVEPSSTKTEGLEAEVVPESESGRSERVRLSRRRRTIAKRLVEAQQTAAMLTTFNDVDMSAVIDLRQRRGEAFQERHGVKLGFMSFFVKGVIGALKAYPHLNAELDGDEMVLKHYYDIGIAVGVEEGLVVPVVRDADRKSFAEIEQEIRDLAQKSQEGSLSVEDLRGGTFTITNGGVFGSLLSTPILNPPQVGILGLHRIEERPIALDGEVVVRPMMYLALSYDHRIVDGREAVQFLGQIKELIESPETLLLEG